MTQEPQSSGQTFAKSYSNDVISLWFVCLSFSAKSCASLYKSGERKDGEYTIVPDGIIWDRFKFGVT